MSQEIEIVETAKLPSRDPQRFGQLDLLVLYETADGSRGVASLPAEGATDEAVASAIRREMEASDAWKGRKLRV